MKLMIVMTLFLSMINAQAQFESLTCQLRNSQDQEEVIVTRDLHDRTRVHFSRDIGVVEATMSIFDTSGSALMVTSLLLDDGGKEIVNSFCSVDVDSSPFIEALILRSEFPEDAICMACEKL